VQILAPARRRPGREVVDAFRRLRGVTTWTRVRRRAAAGDELRVGVFGAGYVGRGLAHVLGSLEGYRCALVVNRSAERGVEALKFAGATEVVTAETVAAAHAAIERGVPAVTSDPAIAIALDELDVLVEGTGSLDYGAEVMLAALEAGRSVVSINAEVDATIGWLLHCAAAAHGGIYTMCDGDQPGGLMRTVDRVRQMTFDPVVAVNCKRHLDVHQSSVESAEYAARDSTSLALTVSAGDGTKMNIEQAVVANLTGMPPERRGMRGIRTDLEHALDDVLAAIDRDGVVEYTLGGDFGAGVFVVARAPDPQAVQTALRFYKLGSGPEYLVFNPYTLVQFDMPQSIAEVVLDGTPLWSPVGEPVADVVAIAKRDLRPGDELDGIGGDCCYGQIDTIAGAAGILPMAYTEHSRVARAVARDEPVPVDAVEIDETAPIVRLRNAQDVALRATV
jgi:predicted homoserine dehydrogenase-like protein